MKEREVEMIVDEIRENRTEIKEIRKDMTKLERDFERRSYQLGKKLMILTSVVASLLGTAGAGVKTALLEIMK